MDEKELDALTALVAAGRRKAGTAAVLAERGTAPEAALARAADRLRETSALAQEALDSVCRDLRELEALAR